MQLLKPRKPQSGFSLIELAIALFVIAILAGGAISALRAQSAYSRIAETREQLREAREALINYTIAHGALPCPADDDQGMPPNTSASCVYKGRLPWQLLGLPAQDPYGQVLRYAVSPAPLSKPLVNPSGNNIAFDSTGSLNLTSNGVSIDPKQAVAFAVWSVGEDAQDASPSAATDNTVVVEAPGADDIVEWTSRYVLLGRMLNAGSSIALTSSSSSSTSSSTP